MWQFIDMKYQAHSGYVWTIGWAMTCQWVKKAGKRKANMCLIFFGFDYGWDVIRLYFSVFVALYMMSCNLDLWYKWLLSHVFHFGSGYLISSRGMRMEHFSVFGSQSKDNQDINSWDISNIPFWNIVCIVNPGIQG